MTATSVPAPVGGWNERDSLDDMEANDAVSMVNMIPRAGFVESRKGSTEYVDLGNSLLPNGILTLIPYQNTALLATYNTSIWNIADPTLPEELTHAAFSGAAFQWTAFQDIIILTNGDDLAVTFNGTVLTDCVFTGHSGEFWGVNTFKGRAFYWEENARSFWYAQAGAYQGVMTEFDLSTQTRTGGTLVQMLTITRDAGDGVDDFAVFVFSTGEAIVYQGDDPEDSLRWSSSGRFQIGEPLGIRAHYKVGGTEIILTKDGWLDISTALSGGRLSEASTYSDKIIRAAKASASKYAHLFGWECLYYPAGNLFIVNVPRSEFEIRNASGSQWGIQAEQHVRNTSTGSWCKFTGWQATTFCVWQDKLYFASGGQVYLADVANDDNGQPISMECIPAFNYLGTRGRKKQITLCNHITNYQKPEYLVKDGMGDFNVQFVNEVPFAPYTGAAKWGISKWNIGRWALGPQLLSNTTEGWQNVSAQGYAVTVSLRIITQGSPFVWYGTNYIYKLIGNR